MTRFEDQILPRGICYWSHLIVWIQDKHKVWCFHFPDLLIPVPPSNRNNKMDFMFKVEHAKTITPPKTITLNLQHKYILIRGRSPS